MTCLLFVLYFRIGNGSIADRAPVDDSCALIDPAFFMHLAEHFGYGLVAAFVHGETLSVPVAGRAHFLKLGDDTSAVFLLPVPCTLQKFLAAQIMLIDSLLLQSFDDLYFGCD